MACSINWEVERSNLMGKITLANALEEIKWNDEYFMSKVFPLFNTAGRVELSVAVLAAETLLEWYLGGKRPIHMCDSILAVWHNMQLKDGISYVLPTSQTSGGQHVLRSPGALTMADLQNYKSGLSKDQETLDVKYVIEWHQVVRNLLDDSGDNNVEKKQQGVNLIGFLFMNMMRTCTKDAKDVCDHIWKTAISPAKNFWNIPENIVKLVPPHLPMALQFSQDIEKTSTNCQMLIGSLVHAFGAKSSQSGNIQSVLKAGCLLSLQHTGLGLINWLIKAANALSLDAVDVMMYLAFDKFTNVSKSILDFLTNTANKELGQYSWRWARLFADGAFYNLRSGANWEYTYILVGLTCGGSPHSDVWDIQSLRHDSYETTKQMALVIATSVLKVRMSTDINQGQTNQARMVIEKSKLAYSYDPLESGEI